MAKIWQRALLVCLSLSLVGCGYHLRGSQQLPSQVQKMNLISLIDEQDQKVLSASLAERGILLSDSTQVLTLQLVALTLEQSPQAELADEVIWQQEARLQWLVLNEVKGLPVSSSRQLVLSHQLATSAQGSSLEQALAEQRAQLIHQLGQRLADELVRLPAQ